MSWRMGVAMAASALCLACSSTTLNPLDGPDESPEPSTGTHTPDQVPNSPTKEGQPTTSPSQAFWAARVPKLPSGVPTQEFNVRLAGDDTQAAGALLFNVGRIRARANGVELPVTQVEQSVDLSFEGNAWLVARVEVPTDATEVSFLLELDSFGGYQRGTDGAPVDARLLPITWTSKVDWLRHRGHTVVHVDVAKSLVKKADGLRLMPHLQILH